MMLSSPLYAKESRLVRKPEVGAPLFGLNNRDSRVVVDGMNERKLDQDASSSVGSPLVSVVKGGYRYLDAGDGEHLVVRPRWVKKEMFERNAAHFREAAENARNLKSMAQTQRASFLQAYDDHRSPPLMTTRVPVEWPSPDLYEAIESKVRFGSETETLVLQQGGQQVSRRDLRHMLDTQWLNDVCINSYIHLLHQRSKRAQETLSEPTWPKCFFFTSFFLEQLYGGRNGYNYDAVRRTTLRAKVDIFSMDKILIPVSLGNHWCLAVINFALKRFEYYDSLGSPNEECIKALRQYLDDEFKNKKGPQGFDCSSWTNFQPKKIPRQHNGYDCGVFALSYANCLSRNVPFDFNELDMPAMRAKILFEVYQNQPLPLPSDK
jgi:hypothetical protein